MTETKVESAREQGRAVGEAATGLAMNAEGTVSAVRRRYGQIAVKASSCCGPSPDASCGCGTEASRRLGYEERELASVPDEADLGLGCGAPVGHLGLGPGETVLDLGSGPGLDALLAARAVGPTGRVIGVDMTPEMLERARQTASRAGATHVEFREGRLEALPVDDASVDAVTSNCVINLVPDKGQVFREAARVLRPGGRMVIADIVLDRPLPEAVAADVLAWTGCVAGAALRHDYFREVEEAGFGTVEVLKDEDALAGFAEVNPEEAERQLAAWGVTHEDLAGAVRAVTWRAVRR
jgi:arsenite methyltransferase